MGSNLQVILDDKIMKRKEVDSLEKIVHIQILRGQTDKRGKMFESMTTILIPEKISIPTKYGKKIPILVAAIYRHKNHWGMKVLDAGKYYNYDPLYKKQKRMTKKIDNLVNRRAHFVFYKFQ
jgi:hypothetical protein